MINKGEQSKPWVSTDYSAGMTLIESEIATYWLKLCWLVEDFWENVLTKFVFDLSTMVRMVDHRCHGDELATPYWTKGPFAMI